MHNHENIISASLKLIFARRGSKEATTISTQLQTFRGQTDGVQEKDLDY